MPRTVIQDMNASLKFEGDALDRRIQIGTPPAIGVSSDFTVGCWVNLSPKSSSQVIYNGNYDFGSNVGYFFRVTGNTGAVGVTVGTNFVSSSSGLFQYNRWNFIVYEMIGTSVNVYINDMTTPATTLSGFTRKADFGTPIGYFAQEYNGAATGNRILGSIRSCFNARAVLTSAQKQALMDNSSIPTLTGGVFYHTNEGAGSVLYDASGNGNNATLTNGTWVSDTPTKKRQQVNGNLVYNGDFEYAPVVNVAQTTNSTWYDGTAGGSATNTLFGWRPQTLGVSAELKFDSSEKYSGLYSLKLSTKTTNTVALAMNSITPFTSAGGAIAVLPSTSYTLTYRMKTNRTSGSATGGARMICSERSGTGTLVSEAGIGTSVITTTDWTFYTVTFTTQATTRFIALKADLTGNDGAATLIMDAWFDDIELLPTTPVTRTAIQDMNSSLSFNGTSTTVVATSITGMSAGFTLATWFKPTKYGASLINNATGTNDRSALFLNASGYFTGAYYNGSFNGARSSGVSSVVLGNWYHVVYTYDGSGGNLYINGTLSNTGTNTPNTDLSNQLAIGFGSGFSGGNYKQSIIYKTALSAAQVLELYSSGSCSATPERYYNFNEGSGTVAYDSSGNGNNGTITSGTYVIDTPTKKRLEVGGNLVYNGDFEYAPPSATNVATNTTARWIDGTAAGSTTNNLFGWNNNSAAAARTFQFVNETGCTGNYCMKIANATGGITVDLRQYLLYNGITNTPILPNTSYTASMRFKITNTTGSATTGVQLAFYTSTGSGAGTTTHTTTAGLYVADTNGWVTATLTFTTSATAAFVNPVVRMVCSDGAATLAMTLFVDDIELRPTTNTVRTAVT